MNNRKEPQSTEEHKTRQSGTTIHNNINIINNITHLTYEMPEEYDLEVVSSLVGGCNIGQTGLLWLRYQERAQEEHLAYSLAL